MIATVDIRHLSPLELGLQRPGSQSTTQGVRSPDPTARLRPDKPVLGQQDSVEISEEARRLFELSGGSGSPVGKDAKTENAAGAKDGKREVDVGAHKAPSQLTETERAEVRELEATDCRVRAHENAHVAAGGQHVSGGIQYDYVRGPDGKTYAVGGEVSIDSSPASTPQETINKAMQVRQAALAPPEPSSQDLAVAARAAQMLADARRELAEQREAKPQEDPEELEVPPVDPRYGRYQIHGGDPSRHIAGVGLDLHT